MATKGYPWRLIQVITGLYKVISIAKKMKLSSRYETNYQVVRQGFPMLPVFFNIYIDAVMEEWQSHLRTDFKLGK
jgi:hypothetical protein